jgi:magnesium-transporting ATPase (P-type)
LYTPLKTGYLLNWKSFLLWTAQAFYHSAIIYLFTYFIGDGVGYMMGQPDGIWFRATLIAVCVNAVIFAKGIIEMNFFNWLEVIGIILSFLSFYVFEIIYSAFTIFPLDGHGYMYYEFCKYFHFLVFLILEIVATCKSLVAWLCIILTVVACLVPDIAFTLFRKIMYPRDWEILLKEDKRSKKKNCLCCKI